MGCRLGGLRGLKLVQIRYSDIGRLIMHKGSLLAHGFAVDSAGMNTVHLHWRAKKSMSLISMVPQLYRKLFVNVRPISCIGF